MSFDLARSLEAAEADDGRGYAPPAAQQPEAAYVAQQPPEQAVPEAPAATYLDPTTELKGSIRCTGNVGIDGKFEGDVQSDAFVVIGHQADVRADISAESVIVAGRVEGNIKASSSVEIQAGGSVVGNLTANELHIEGGGILKGQTFTGSGAELPEPARPARSSSRAKRAEREPATAAAGDTSEPE